MSLTIVTGFTNTAHVTADDDAALNNGIIGSGDFVLNNGNKLSAALINANTVRISDGDLTVQGRLARLIQGTTQDLTITNGTVGQKRNDLIIARYAKLVGDPPNTESITFAVVQGTNHASTPVDPALVSGVLRNGAVIHEMVLYRIPLNGLTVGTPVQLFSVSQQLNQFETLFRDEGLTALMPAINMAPESYLRRDKFSGICTLKLYTPGQTVTNQQIIGYLPERFRPSEPSNPANTYVLCLCQAYFLGNGGWLSSDLQISLDGAIKSSHPINADNATIYAEVSWKGQVGD